MKGMQVNLALMLLSESTICCHVTVKKLNLELFNLLHICLICGHIVSLDTDELLSFSQWLLKFTVL